MSDTSRLKIAAFIDFDNIEIGVKSTLGSQFDVGVVLEALKERGELVSKTAYADWKRAGELGRSIGQHAIKMVQRNLTPGGDKNGADINLALDALELAFTHDHINAFAIVGGDSDFITLVEKLKQYDKTVFIVGGRQFTSAILQRNCHEFIAYENLVGGRRSAERGRSPAQASIAQVFPLVKRALKILVDREVSPQLGLLKSTLLQLDSTFSERSYGASSFRDFAEKLAATGLVSLKHAGRSIHVELVEGVAAEPDRHAAREADAAPPAAAEPPAVPVAEIDPAQVAEAVLVVRQGLQAANPRWPLYIRQVKQLLRAADPTFDERRWGFSSLVELLKACQREGLLRLERDRVGVLRVFAGAALREETPADAPQPLESTADEAAEGAVEPPAGADGSGAAEPAEAQAPEAEKKPRRRRAATPATERVRQPAARAPRKKAATPDGAKPSRARGKKIADAAAGEGTG